MTAAPPNQGAGPIGLFDSGVGGLSVLRAVQELLPAEDLVYVADTIHCPYGARPIEEVRALSEGIARYLIEQEGAKLIVVACNTASAAALGHLRAAFQVPFVGMVPAVKPATGMTISGVVGVLATATTLQSALYYDVMAHIDGHARVLGQVGHGLVEQVEQGDLDGPETLALLQGCLQPLLEAGMDTLVLGCTHYPFLIPAMRQIVGESVQILEPSAAVARQTGRVLDARGARRAGDQVGQLRLTTTDDPVHFARVLEQLLPTHSSALHLAWDSGRLRPA